MAIQDIPTQTGVFPYLHLALVFIVAEYALEHYISILQLNRKVKNTTLPSVLKPLEIQDEEYQKSRSYTIAKLRFGLAVETIETIIKCVLLYFYYGPWVWNLSADILSKMGRDPSSEFMRALVVLGIEYVREKITGIPISLIHSFVLEARYGFNKMTIGTFIKDEIKKLLLSVVLTPPILYVLLWVIEAGGQYFYIYVEVVVFVIIIIMMFLYPNFIAPLFNKFEDLKEGSLRDKIYALASKLDYPLKKIFVCDGSKRSSHSNAYLFGFWKNKRIVLFDTILEHLDEDEIEAVLGHELGHWKKGHTWKLMIMSLVQIFVTFYVYGFFMYNKGIFQSFGYKDQSIFIGLLLFSSMYAPISYILGILSLRITRTFEYQADEFSVQHGYGNKLSSGLIKMFKKNAGDMDPHPMYAAFKYSHPALIERLNHITAVQKKQ
mmetsp:Transcript_19023/g.21794  ORF Transcript_19023/g.21794 Transcript_19023/m.21794 type:complete len:435 (+) Transcript_19023:44-1348(+)